MNLVDKVCVVGLGYIGLPTASVIASSGTFVHGVDIDSGKLSLINQGISPIEEPGLQDLIEEAVESQMLVAYEAPDYCDVFLICVPTPSDFQKQPDLKQVYSACASILPYLRKGNLVVLESTCPVGTTEDLCKWFSSQRKDLSFPGEDVPDPDVNIAYCPERAIPGNSINELINNDRIIGGLSYSCNTKAKLFYKLFSRGELITTNSKLAEFSKLVENSYRDVNIAFSNEISSICEKLGINQWDLVNIANRHPRVNILNPGIGVGGHCIPVDPWFLIDQFPQETTLLKQSRVVNDSVPDKVAQEIQGEIDCFINRHPSNSKPVVTFFGVAYKENVADVRLSPALDICLKIMEDNKSPMMIVEPNIFDLPPCLEQFDCKLVDLEMGLQSDLLIFLVKHTEFEQIDNFNTTGKKIFKYKV